MADVHSKEIRSYNKSRIKGKNTKPEILVRKYLYHNGFRYRINVKKLPATPDIGLAKYRIVIFINGCFWHGHMGCPKYVIPKTRTEWWMNKIQQNINRDEKANKNLLEMGWHIAVLWECELTKFKFESTMNFLLQRIKKSDIIVRHSNYRVISGLNNNLSIVGGIAIFTE